MMIDLAKRFQHVSARFGKVGCNFDKASACVSETVTDDDLQCVGQLGHVPRERITHLDWSPHRGRPLHQYVAKILSGVLATREKQSDLAALTCGNNATGEDARPMGAVG